MRFDARASRCPSQRDACPWCGRHLPDNLLLETSIHSIHNTLHQAPAQAFMKRRFCKVDVRSSQGATALMFAADAGDEEICSMLLCAGADLHVPQQK